MMIINSYYIYLNIIVGFKTYLDDDDFMKMIDGENKEKQTPLMYAAIKGVIIFYFIH
jgi:hypothetical protein